jgi:transglutaminase-like putative cysteine protease
MRYDGRDTFDNPFVILDVEAPHKEFVLHARSVIETTPPPPTDFQKSTPWDQLDDVLYQHQSPIDLDVVQFRCASRVTTATTEIADYAFQSFPAGCPVLEGAWDLTKRVYSDFTFDPEATDISTPITQVFRQRRGVCQDFAHLTLACLRALRIPARYISGYILTRPPPGQAKLQGSDASHAWISVWSQGTGWRDFDPTNRSIVGEEHIVIAHGRDYSDVCPLSGILLGGGEHTVSVGVDVAAVS